MILNKKFFELPPVYKLSETNFWAEEHISKELLKAHLNTNYDGASRSYEFIDQSVEWICNTIPPVQYPVMLDLGCGPGLYAERFYKKGYSVTGIDVSMNSINYARNSALEKGLDITYHCQDYLDTEIEGEYDIVTMIYCDYGALSSDNRQKLMKKIYRCLKPGGVFLLDVFTTKKYENFKDMQSWEYCQDGGFWREDSYLLLNVNCKYQNFITLEQYIVMTDETAKTYYIWNTYFTKECFTEEAGKAGFKVKNIFGNMAGHPYSEDGETNAFLLVK